MMCGIELVEKKETRAPAISLRPAASQGRGAVARPDLPPARRRGRPGDQRHHLASRRRCRHRTGTLDRIPDIIRASIVAATSEYRPPCPGPAASSLSMLQVHRPMRGRATGTGCRDCRLIFLRRSGIRTVWPPAEKIRYRLRRPKSGSSSSAPCWRCFWPRWTRPSSPLALPPIANDLGDFALISWVVTAHLLTSTCATPIVGKLSDLYGRRKVLSVCLGLFMAAFGPLRAGARHGSAHPGAGTAGAGRRRPDDAGAGDHRRRRVAARARPLCRLFLDRVGRVIGARADARRHRHATLWLARGSSGSICRSASWRCSSPIAPCASCRWLIAARRSTMPVSCCCRAPPLRCF